MKKKHIALLVITLSLSGLFSNTSFANANNGMKEIKNPQTQYAETQINNLVKETKLPLNDISEYMQAGYNQEDIESAYVLSLLTSKTLDEIIAQKTPNTNWTDVREFHGISMDLFNAKLESIKIANEGEKGRKNLWWKNPINNGFK